MAKIVINNRLCSDQSEDSGSAGIAASAQTGGRIHFLDVWGDTPPTRKAVSLAIAATPEPCKPELATGASVSRYGSFKSALVSWGLIIG